MTAQPTKNKGPLAGYGVICEAVSGIRHITGDADRPPGRIATSTTDYITGLYAAFGAMLARVEHEDAIDDIITRWTLKHTCAEAEKKLHAAEVPAARIYTAAIASARIPVRF